MEFCFSIDLGERIFDKRDVLGFEIVGGVCLDGELRSLWLFFVGFMEED
jgi:hypothetical protein